MALNIYSLFTRHTFNNGKPDYPQFYCSYINRETALEKATKGESYGDYVSEMTVQSWTGDCFSGRYYVSEWFYFNRQGDIISHRIFESKLEGYDLTYSVEYAEWIRDRNAEAEVLRSKA